MPAGLRDPSPRPPVVARRLWASPIVCRRFLSVDDHASLRELLLQTAVIRARLESNVKTVQV
jgi:hypothetical protein